MGLKYTSSMKWVENKQKSMKHLNFILIKLEDCNDSTPHSTPLLHKKPIYPNNFTIFTHALKNDMRTNIIFDTSAMGINSGSRQCCRKCRPVWDLQRQKNAAVRISISVVFIFTTHIVVDYFCKIN